MLTKLKQLLKLQDKTYDVVPYHAYPLARQSTQQQVINIPPVDYTSHKLVRVENGLYVSLVSYIDGANPIIYRVGDTLYDEADEYHGGGLYSFLANPGQLIRAFLQGHVINDITTGEYAVLKTVVSGPFVQYDERGNCLGFTDRPTKHGKFAASEMYIQSVEVQFSISAYQTGYYAYERQTHFKFTQSYPFFEEHDL